MTTEWTHDLAVPAVVLGVGAHPDDVEFQAGTTLARWADAGALIHLVVCTDGSKGTWDPDASLAELIGTRQAEQVEAARRLGIRGEIVHLGWVDGEVSPSPEGVRQIGREIRRLRPDVVLTHDPWKRYRLHPDHRNVGWLTVDALVAARDPHFLTDLELPPHRPTTLLLFEADEPDHAETATDGIDAQVDSLLAHRSQFESTMGITDDTAEEVAAFRHRLRTKLDAMADAAGRDDPVQIFKRIDDL